MLGNYLTKFNVLIAFSVLYSLSSSLLVYSGVWVSDDTSLFFNFSIIFLMAWWVKEDMNRKRFYGPYEFPAFVFFAWPVVLPYYLIKTRGWKGILSSAGFFAVILGPHLLTTTIYIIKWEI